MNDSQKLDRGLSFSTPRGVRKKVKIDRLKSIKSKHKNRLYSISRILEPRRKREGTGISDLHPGKRKPTDLIFEKRSKLKLVIGNRKEKIPEGMGVGKEDNV